MRVDGSVMNTLVDDICQPIVFIPGHDFREQETLFPVAHELSTFVFECHDN